MIRNKKHHWASLQFLHGTTNKMCIYTQTAKHLQTQQCVCGKKLLLAMSLFFKEMFLKERLSLLCVSLISLFVHVRYLITSCGHNPTVLWVLALREVLKDKAKVSQAVFEGGQGQERSLVSRVELKDGQQPPTPRRTISRGLEEVHYGKAQSLQGPLFKQVI